jgi:hypothetical protein
MADLPAAVRAILLSAIKESGAAGVERLRPNTFRFLGQLLLTSRRSPPCSG